MSQLALGEHDEFAVEGRLLDRSSSGIATERVADNLGKDDPFLLVHFMRDETEHGSQDFIIHTAPAMPEYAIEAEIAFVDGTEPHDVAAHVAEALEGTGLYVVHQWNSEDYYIVSEIEDAN